MAKREYIILNSGDVGMTAASFDVFWTKLEDPWEDFYQFEASVQRNSNSDCVQVEYIAFCDWASEYDRYHHSCGGIRFRALPDGRQEIGWWSASPPDEEYDSGGNIVYRSSFEPLLSMEWLFNSFVDHLRKEGYQVKPVPLHTDDDAGEKRGPNIETIPKVARARLIMERKGKGQKVACDLAAVAPKTFRIWCNHEMTQKEMEHLEHDRDFLDFLEGI